MVDALATGDSCVADMRFDSNSVHSLCDEVLRLRTFNATTRFSNMTGKWQASLIAERQVC